MPKKDTLTIRFGLMFRPRVGDHAIPGRVDVVTNVGKGSYFLIASLARNEESPTIPMLSGGTASTKNVDKVIGRMKLPDLTEAYRRGYARAGFHFSENSEKALAKASKAKARKLKWE